jgi:hypothetical protein
VRSASAIMLLGVIAGLAGCTTTQQKAAWLRMNDARLRASELSVRVTTPGSAVAVEQVSAVAGGGRSALVVRVRNLRSRTLSDLPISVGAVGASGRRTYFNGAPGLDFFKTHLPPIPARGQLTWVYTTGARMPGGARPFARVGSRSLQAPSSLPQIRVLRRRGGGVAAGALRLTVVNRSSIPQYQLPVYAVVRRGGRYLAAGEGTIGDLAGGSSSAIRLPLVGKPAGALELEAPPTIFT